MKIKIGIFIFLLIGLAELSAQINARLFQYPDVSDAKITFVYADDIWIVDKNGGEAARLSSPEGGEILPKFSPDGGTIAFGANYNGNTDIYTIPITGGVPKRITYHSSSERMLDWTKGGEDILFASTRESGRQRFAQLYEIPAEGGSAVKLPVPYGEFGAVSGDGKWLAYTPRTRLYRTWKRYKGGMAADIWLFNLKTYESSNITNNEANDEMPMWHGNKIYFLSDRGKENRYNIWVYDLNDKSTKQVTFFKNYDVHFPSIGNNDLVFEAEGKLYLLNLGANEYKPVDITIVSDQIALVPQLKKVSKYIYSLSISPDGNRAAVEARGEIFSVPAKDGVIYNLTNSSGSAERYPAWSPDGKNIAYWSDASGEYELMMRNIISGKTTKLTSTGGKYKYNLNWSPDSKKIVFIDNSMHIRLLDAGSGDITEVDQSLYMMHDALEAFEVKWSSDGRYFTYSRGLPNQQSAIFIYDTEQEKLHQITSGFYSDSDPVFSADGKYLFLITKQHFAPVYSSLDNTFIYPNAEKLALIPLSEDEISPLSAKNDTVKIKIDKETDDEKDADKNDKAGKKEKSKKVKIDFAGLESRMVLLPVSAGNFGNLQSVKGKLVYHKYAPSGAKDKSNPINYFDLKERKEKTILKDAGFFDISADGKKMLVGLKGKYYVVDVKANQKTKDALPTGDLETVINPEEEWAQIFNDAWRLERDFFYDPNMHGVDWEGVRENYGKLVKYAASRNDLNFLIGEMIGELNSSHSYKGGGDIEYGKRKNVGYLGIDWQADGGYYKIGKIIKGADWDAEVRSPLDEPGIKVKEGDYILAVNGVPITADKEPFAAFAGLAGKTVELTINSTADFDGAEKIIVKTMKSESRLRHLAWINKNRETVDKLSGGKIGYIYVRSTGVDGQNELIRQFLPQTDKAGLIIDERFNSGGQIPDRFIEMLNRKPLAFWKVRDGRNWQWPPDANFGPKAMLINGWSGSGGDAFPDYFRKAGLGKLIGRRTWGGLIGITGAPGLIDGGYLTVPTFRMYNPDGTWFKEGHGVDPDIEVVDNPTLMAKGHDPQLERAVREVLSEIKANPNPYPEVPAPEKR